jgi:hypothetical protein
MRGKPAMRINYCEIEKRLANRTGTFALLTMQATSTTGRLMAKFPTRFKALFSAEHGFFCVAAAGILCPFTCCTNLY